MKTRLYLWIALLAACSSDGAGDAGGGADAGAETDAAVASPDGRSETSRVTVVSGRGAPRAGVPVVFQGADGRVLEVVTTGADGGATGRMEPDGMVTFVFDGSPTWALETWTGLQPGADLEVGRRIADDPVVGQLTPVLPGAFSGGGGYRIQLGCNFNNARTVDANWAPGRDPATLEVTQSCVSNTNTVAVAATAQVGDTILGYTIVPAAVLDESGATTVTLPAWRSDFDRSDYSLSGLDLDAFSASIGLELVENDHRLAYVGQGSDALGSGAFATALLVPHAIPMARLNASIHFDDVLGSSIGIDRRPALAASTAITQADFLPRITEAELADSEDPTRPKATWAYAAPFPELTRLELWVSTGKRLGWLVRMPAGTAPTEFRFPELPAELAVHRPTAAAGLTSVRVELDDASGTRFSKAHGGT